jgi:TRAP-type mannitol/chloroaromatic compound transport system permease large subunit
VLVVLADQARPLGRRHVRGAIGPSIIQVALFCAWVLIVSLIWPKDVPALPLEGAHAHGWAL